METVSTNHEQLNLLILLATVAVIVLIPSLVFVVMVWRELNLLRTNRERLTPPLRELFGRPIPKPRQHRSRI